MRLPTTLALLVTLAQPALGAEPYRIGMSAAPVGDWTRLDLR